MWRHSLEYADNVYQKQGTQFWTFGIYQAVKYGKSRGLSRAGKTVLDVQNASQPGKTQKTSFFMQ